MRPEESLRRYSFDGELFVQDSRGLWDGRSTGQTFLGEALDPSSTPLGYADDRHISLISGSRGGKGASVIIPNLCLWPGSCIVIDPKGENANVTARRRGAGSPYAHGMGQTVRILDPFNEVQLDSSLKARFNPLDTINPAGDFAVDEAGSVAAALVSIQNQKEPFWELSARNLIKALILHVLTDVDFKGRRNLVSVWRLLTQGNWIAAAALRADGDQNIPSSFLLLWEIMARNTAFNGLIAGVGEQFRGMAERTRDTILKTAHTYVEFIDSTPMQRCLEASDFRLSELKTASNGLSVYLTLPQRHMDTHSGWLRLIIALAVAEMERTKTRPATGHPTLFVLDEFAGLKRMEVIENAAAQAAGFGVKFLFVIQHFGKLEEIYGKSWETFFGNSGLKIFFSLDDESTRGYLSRQLGEQEVTRETKSGSAATGVSTAKGSSTTVGSSRSATSGTSLSNTTGETHGKTTGETTGVTKGVTTGSTSGRTIGDNSGHSRGSSGPFLGFGTSSSSYSWGDSTSNSSSSSSSSSSSRSNSQSESTSWSRSDSRTGSQNSSKTNSQSASDSTSVTQTSSATDTDGWGEAIHKRLLLNPDEIGQLLARVDDPGDARYPGLMVALLPGQNPLPVRRVNYFESPRFAGLFDPHPLYPPPHTLDALAAREAERRAAELAAEAEARRIAEMEQREEAERARRDFEQLVAERAAWERKHRKLLELAKEEAAEKARKRRIRTQLSALVFFSVLAGLSYLGYRGGMAVVRWWNGDPAIITVDLMEDSDAKLTEKRVSTSPPVLGYFPRGTALTLVRKVTDSQGWDWLEVSGVNNSGKVQDAYVRPDLLVNASLSPQPTLLMGANITPPSPDYRCATAVGAKTRTHFLWWEWIKPTDQTDIYALDFDPQQPGRYVAHVVSHLDRGTGIAITDPIRTADGREWHTIPYNNGSFGYLRPDQIEPRRC